MCASCQTRPGSCPCGHVTVRPGRCLSWPSGPTQVKPTCHLPSSSLGAAGRCAGRCTGRCPAVLRSCLPVPESSTRQEVGAIASLSLRQGRGRGLGVTSISQRHVTLRTGFDSGPLRGRDGHGRGPSPGRPRTGVQLAREGARGRAGPTRTGAGGSSAVSASTTEGCPVCFRWRLRDGRVLKCHSRECVVLSSHNHSENRLPERGQFHGKLKEALRAVRRKDWLL